MRRKLAFLSWALLGISVSAADLVSPFTLENSQVLPAGVRNFRFYDLAMSLDTRFTGSGAGEPLGYRLNKSVSWHDVLDSQEDAAKKNVVRGILKDKAIAESTSPGDATGIAGVSANVKVPVLAAGITDRLTVGVIVPVVTLSSQVDTGFVRSSEGQNFIAAVCEQSPAQCNDAAAKLNRATHSKLERLNYNPLTSQTVTAIGDIQLMAQYQWLGNLYGGLSTRLLVTLPTGIGPNADNALDLATGDGRFKVGPAIIYDWSPFYNSKWNFFASYQALLPHEMARRLPVSGDDELSNDKVSLVRQWGELVSLGTSFHYLVERWGLRLGGGYNFQYLSQTHYGGGPAAATPERVGWLQDLDPAQTLHSLIATVGFSTVQWYIEKKFPLPFQLNVALSHPVYGTNSPTNDVIAGEAVMFF